MSLSVKDLRKSYRTIEGRTVQVIDISDYEFPQGSQTALVGASGCGKTTFLNLTSGIIRADAGEIRVADELLPVSEHRRDLFRARHIGYIFQTFNLLQGFTALENVLLGMLFARKTDAHDATVRAGELLARVGLTHRARHKPAQLSVGEQQRVALARAVANKPALILADEPTGSLDEKNARLILALVKEICAEENATLVCVTHEPPVMKEFPNIIELKSINRAAGEVLA
ncbi:MAG: ABC transporter ATP-binding protein [Planctomycetota bacterium]